MKFGTLFEANIFSFDTLCIQRIWPIHDLFQQSSVYTYVLADLLNYYFLIYINELYSTSCVIVLKGRNTSAIRETEHII